MAGVPHIFDAKARALHRARAARRRGSSFLVAEAAAGVAERVGAANRSFDLALEVGSADAAFAVVQSLAANWQRVEIGDDERIDLPKERFDLAVSVLALHAVNDMPGVLIQIARALKPDGLFVAALFGGDTLQELRAALATGEDTVAAGASPRVSPFADVRDLGGLLQRAGFNLPVADLERTTVRYKEFNTLVDDLRTAGETNALAERSRRSMRRDILGATMAAYRDLHSEPDGRLRATFDVVFLTGWKPHDGQQKPLARGSAKMRLADVLCATGDDGAQA